MAGNTAVRLIADNSMECGDGVTGKLYHGKALLWRAALEPGAPALEWSGMIHLGVGDSLDLLISPNKNSACDSVNVMISLLINTQFVTDNEGTATQESLHHTPLSKARVSETISSQRDFVMFS